MDRYFRKEDGTLVNLQEHIIEEIEKNPNLTIYIGTDSQNRGDHSVYVVVIVFRYGLRGAHFVYYKDKVPRIRDIFTRLYKEAEYTIELAEQIKEDLPVVKIEALEFDYNGNKLTKSTNVIAATKGWAESLGYKAHVKPEQLLAVKAADYICRN